MTQIWEDYSSQFGKLADPLCKRRYRQIPHKLTILNVKKCISIIEYYVELFMSNALTTKTALGESSQDGYAAEMRELRANLARENFTHPELCTENQNVGMRASKEIYISSILRNALLRYRG